MLLLLALAHAEPSAKAADAAPCMQQEVWATSPPPLAMNVPLDTIPAGLLTVTGCGSESWTGTLSIPTVGEVATVTHGADDGLLVEVDPGADLLPDTTYSLRFESGGGVSSEIGFTTGSGRVVGFDGAPTVESLDVFWQNSGATTVQAEVGVVAAAEGDSVVEIAIEGEAAGLDATTSSGPAVVQLFGNTLFEDAPAEVCVVARQRDWAGVWTESAPMCVAPQHEALDGGGCFDGDGCGSSGGEVPPSVGFALLFAGLARRRRAVPAPGSGTREAGRA